MSFSTYTYPTFCKGYISISSLLASAARSWSGGTGTARGSCQMPPHLLAVGAGNSGDPGPARLRQEAKRGARWLLQPIGEEIEPATATTDVPVNTSRSNGTEFQKRERSCQELRGPGAERKHGPRGRRRQIAHTAEECTGCCRRRHRSLRGHQPHKFVRGAGRPAAT